MINYEDIQHLKEADIRRVVEACGVQLKERSGRLTACCPFHNEKTPSFTVNEDGHYFHCFGCHEHGNPIDFIMRHRGLGFVEAVKAVAEITGYELTEEEVQNPAEQKRAMEKEKVRRGLKAINKEAMVWFQRCLEENRLAQEYVYGRWSKETVELWGIGYAPDNGHALSEYLESKGYRGDQIEAAGLSATGRNGQRYDLFRGRVMFPIKDQMHEVLGFSGRQLVLDETKGGKYINTRTTEVYKKSDVLFGLNMAAAKIRKSGEAVLVEGNPDTVKMHQLGVTNVVACCGTALPTEVIEKLKSMCRTVTLMYDSDEAGQENTKGNGRRLLEAGLTVYTLTIPDKEGMTGKAAKQDPDTFFKDKAHYDEFDRANRKPWLQWWAEKNQWMANDPSRSASFKADTVQLLKGMPSYERNGYITMLAKLFPTKGEWNAAMKEALSSGSASLEVNEEGFTAEEAAMLKRWRFYERNHHYYVKSSENAYRDVSNFTLEPLFHIKSTYDARRLYRMTNDCGVSEDMDLEQKALTSKQAFITAVESLGNFLFTGNDADLSVIKGYLYANTKSCKKITQLGWQKEGFWAWANGALTAEGAWIPINDLGIVQVGGMEYYIPACSSVTEMDEGLYTQERKTIHEESQADLKTWCTKMRATYGENAVVAVSYCLAALFRDVCVARFDCFPLLFVFGQKGTGKTKFIVSLMGLMGKPEKGTDLTNLTDSAMGEYLSKVRNGYVHIDEYKNDARPTQIAMLKGVYDSRGRSKMNMDRGKQREQTPADCGLILSGQEMCTADNALFSRTIYLTTAKTSWTEEEQKVFEDLKDYEKQSLTPITNRLLSHRRAVEEAFGKSYQQAYDDLRHEVEVGKIDGRIVEDWCMVLAVQHALLGCGVELPWGYSQLVETFASLIERQAASVSDTNEVSDFWHGVETLLSDGEIELEYDMKVEYGKLGMRLDVGEGKSRHVWEVQRAYDVVVLNPARVFKAYARMNAQAKTRGGGTVPQETLMYYLKAQSEYMGSKTERFKVAQRKHDDPRASMAWDQNGVPERIEQTKQSRNTLVFDYAKLKEKYGVDFDIRVEDGKPQDFGGLPFA